MYCASVSVCTCACVCVFHFSRANMCVLCEGKRMGEGLERRADSRDDGGGGEEKEEGVRGLRVR